VLIDYRSPTSENLNPGQSQNPLVHAVEARDLVVLVGEQGVPVEMRLARIGPDGPAVALGDLEILAEVRGVGEQLLRDAADVDAGAAEPARLGDGDARAVGGGNAARANAAGTASYGEEVVVEANFSISGWAG
jgi:hypothetical protein